MKKGLFGLIFVLCFAMPAYSEDLSKYSDAEIEVFKNSYADGVRHECLVRGLKRRPDVKETVEAYCLCVSDKVRKTLTRSKLEGVIANPRSLTMEDINACLQQSGFEINQMLSGSEE